jgi:hypothetical protein
MTKKFFTVELSTIKYRVFMDDVNRIVKRTKKVRPALPPFPDMTALSQRKESDTLKDRLSDETAG